MSLTWDSVCTISHSRHANSSLPASLVVAAPSMLSIPPTRSSGQTWYSWWEERKPLSLKQQPKRRQPTQHWPRVGWRMRSLPSSTLKEFFRAHQLEKTYWCVPLSSSRLSSRRLEKPNMARPSERDLIEPKVREYCHRAIKTTAEEMPLSFLGMSRRLNVNRATLKKYFSSLITSAQHQQQGNSATGERKRRPLECAEKLRDRD